MPEPRDAPKRCLWLRLDVTLDNDPKIGALAEAMGCDYERALARYARLLIGTRIHAPSGELTGITDATIGGWMRAPGRKAKEWVAALRDVRIIVSDALNGWGERQGAIIDKAEKDAKRLLEYRNAQRKGAFATRDESATVAGSVAGSVALSSRVISSSSSNSNTDEKMKDIGAASPRPKKTALTKHAEKATVQIAIDAYHEAHLQATGEKPHIDGQAAKLAQGALKTLSLEDVASLLPIYFAEEIAPSAANFFTPWRFEKLRAARRASSMRPAAESPDARRSRRLDALTAAVFARVDFGATGKIPRLFGDALVDLQCDERTIGIRRDPTGKLRDVRIEFVEVRLLDAMDADGVPDNGIAAWAAREVQIVHPPAAAQDRSGAA